MGERPPTGCDGAGLPSVSPQTPGAAPRHAHADPLTRSLEDVRPRPAPRAARRPVPAPRRCPRGIAPDPGPTARLSLDLTGDPRLEEVAV